MSLQHQKHLSRIPPVVSLQVNAVDHLGQTALHRAARCGHLQTCRLLLTAGCDPLLMSLQGLSPSQLGNESVQEILQGDGSSHLFLIVSFFNSKGNQVLETLLHQTYVDVWNTVMFVSVI